MLSVHLESMCAEKMSRQVGVDGRGIVCEGERNVELAVHGICISIKAIVFVKLIDSTDIVLGMDAVNQT